jgi:RNA polymerase sigma-70 factor (ECF subfamily)
MSKQRLVQLTIETALLPKISNGDETAVADCMNRYGGLVWSLARRACPDHQTAEDAVQDIFVQIWKSADRFNEAIASETTFIAMIARRRLIDMSRKKSWNQARAVGGETNPLGEATSALEPAEETMELREEAAKASELLKQLPGDQQRVLKLSIYEGLSHSNIAAATGLSLGTVKTHIRRGLIKLREALFQANLELPDPRLVRGEVKS